MAPNAAAARYLLVTTLLLALAGDILLRVGPWGLNFAVAALLLYAGIALLSRRLHDPVPLEAWPIAGFGFLTAVCLGWRDSTDLAVSNVMATLGAALLVTARKRPGELVRMTFLDHLHQALLQTIHVAVGFVILLLRDLRVGNGEEEGRRRGRGRVWLGIALAIPALLVFGALLTAADAKFEYLITEVLRIDFWTLMGHASLIVFLGWVVGGFLRGRFFATEFAPTPNLFPKRISLGITETAIILGSLDVLFGAFVVVQSSYFFGGHAIVLGTPSLTYAEYARRGFFELITVAALSLPLLLMADWLLRPEHARELRLFRFLSAVMVALLAVMLASAMHRLYLYMQAYGLTTARVHAAAMLVWITVILVLFCATVLRGKRNLLPFAIAVSGFIVLIGLNAVSPDALVARVNIARMASDGKFDSKCTFMLSADAVPIFLENMSAMEAEHRSVLAERLLTRYLADKPNEDIRTWNVARVEAHALVREREAELRGYLLPRATSSPGTR